MPELLHTALVGLPPPKVGKVREVYELDDAMLIVATDRISAFDVVMANGIPDKGKILNQMSRFWFDSLKDICPNHVLSYEDAEVAARCPNSQPELAGRAMLAKKAKPLTIECVARGYITGSLYKEYRSFGPDIYELDLPDGLLDGSALPTPIFTPATKAEEGHDENISFNQAVDRVGWEVAELVREWTMELYRRAADHALSKGLILADTKFEFGETDDGIILIDEALTPDSSRYWDASLYEPGRAQPSFDKQYVRDYLESINWNKMPPGPTLPAEVVANTRAKYVQAFELVTGLQFVDSSV